jgi:hypothetical protein
LSSNYENEICEKIREEVPIIQREFLLTRNFRVCSFPSLEEKNENSIQVNPRTCEKQRPTGVLGRRLGSGTLGLDCDLPSAFGLPKKIVKVV